MFRGGRRLGVEIKRADAPTLTPSIRSALTDLNLEQLVVLHPGSQAYQLGQRAGAPPWVECNLTGLSFADFHRVRR